MVVVVGGGWEAGVTPLPKPVWVWAGRKASWVTELATERPPPARLALLLPASVKTGRVRERGGGVRGSGAGERTYLPASVKTESSSRAEPHSPRRRRSPGDIVCG